MGSEGFFHGCMFGSNEFPSPGILLALLLLHVLFPQVPLRALPSMCDRLDFLGEVWFVIYCYVKCVLDSGVTPTRGTSTARRREGDLKALLLCRLSSSSWIKGFGNR